MNQAAYVRISEFCDTGSGTTPSRSRIEDYYGGTIPWVKSGELREKIIVDTEEKVTPLALKQTSLKLVPSGAILVAMYGATVGRVGILGTKATTNQAVCHVVPDPAKADTRYIFHALQQKSAELISNAVGGAQPNISQSTIKDTRIYLPNLGEQRRIAAILDAADALRAKRRAASAKLDTLPQSIFIEMFGDDVVNSPRVPLRDLVSEFRYGTSNKSGISGYKTLRIPNVIGGQIDVSELKLVQVEPAELERLRLINGDLLFVRTNGNPEYVGRCAIFNSGDIAANVHDNSNWIYASYLIRARLKKDRINPLFLREFLFTMEGRSALRERAKTSAGQYNINTEGLGNIPILVPPLDRQQIFVDRLLSVEPLSKKLLISQISVDNLFLSLQHRAFRGEL